MWFENADKVIFHDPLAAAAIFDDEICTFENGNVQIDLSSGELLGSTIFEKNKNGKHKVANTVNTERFFEHYFNILEK